MGKTEFISIPLEEYVKLRENLAKSVNLQTRYDAVRKHYLYKVNLLKNYVKDKNDNYLQSDYVYQNMIIEISAIAEFLLMCNAITADEFVEITKFLLLDEEKQSKELNNE